jgi:hypothetical protein
VKSLNGYGIAISIVALFGIGFAQSDSTAESTGQPDSTQAVQKKGGEIPDKDNPVVRTSDLAAQLDNITNNERLTVATAWTINLNGYGMLGILNTQLKNSAANPYLTFAAPGAGSGAAIGSGINLGGDLRTDPHEDGDLHWALCFVLGAANSATTINFGNVNLKWDLLTTKQKEDPFYTNNITFGQQLIPFGSDNLASEDKRPTIAVAQYASRIGSGRDIGLLIDQGFWNTTDPINSITVPKLELIASVFNGAGANKIDTGAITSKDVILKAIYSPIQSFTNPLGQLTFAGTAWWKGLDVGLKTDDGKLEVPTKRFIGEIDWLKKPLLITAEYLQFYKSPLTPTKGVTDTAGNSFVGTVFYTNDALPDFQPLVRFDYYDPDFSNNDTLNVKTKLASDKTDATLWITAGFNDFFYQVFPTSWRPYKIKETNRVIKLQLNYTWKIEQQNGQWVNHLLNNVLAAQAWFNF